jgi:hypothetical protein
VAVIGLQPITLKNATFMVAEDDFTAAITQAVFVPQVIWSWADALCGGSVPLYERVRWVCQVGYVQDFETAGSLSRYLIEHAAQTRTVVFAPVAGGPAVQADVMIVPGPLGGVPNQHLTGSVTMPLFDEPSLGSVVAA